MNYYDERFKVLREAKDEAEERISFYEDVVQRLDEKKKEYDNKILEKIVNG